MAAEKMDRILELVVFSLRDGTTREQFLGTVDAVTQWARTQPGFVSRELSCAPEHDKWVDVVYWETMEQAKTAAAASRTAPECTPMFSLIDRASMLFLHAVPALRVTPIRSPRRSGFTSWRTTRR